MNNEIKYDIYKDNPPPNSRPLKSQVTELRTKIDTMRLNSDERELLQSLYDSYILLGNEPAKNFLSDSRPEKYRKDADILKGLLERL